jgi:hypothetical protein
VQRDNDRDRAIEHVLRQVSAAAPLDDRACVDGETIAAWTEGQLRGAEADTIERHLSTCARCQQLLAAFARTSPPPVVAMPLWRRWRLQWLVPIATAATVAAIWVATPQQDRAAYVEAPAPNQATRALESAPAPSQPAAEKPRSVEESDAASSRRNQANTPARKAASPPAASPALDKREEFEKRLDDQKAIVDLQAPPAAAAPPPSTPALPPSAPPPRAEADTEKRDTGLRPQQRESTAAGAVAETAPRAPQAAPTSANEPRERSAQVGALRGFAQTSAPREIVSPNPANRWRITGGRQVERTTNSGTRWEAVTLPPSTGVLTAGTSPAPTVCWIVGRGGTVYLTTDGSRFIRIAFPEPLDLVSITATDDRHATVTAADGRTFATADRGETWATARP